MNPEHSSLTAEHYTPRALTDMAREVMGDIDLDPASSHAANRLVDARRYYTLEAGVDGLEQQWTGRLWINPPGDSTGALPRKFWGKLAASVASGRVSEFIWLAFNISQLRTLQHCRWLLEECSVCIPQDRIKFIKAFEVPPQADLFATSNMLPAPVEGTSPTKDNALMYWGKRHRLFRQVFGRLGLVL